MEIPEENLIDVYIDTLMILRTEEGKYVKIEWVCDRCKSRRGEMLGGTSVKGILGIDMAEPGEKYDYIGTWK